MSAPRNGGLYWKYHTCTIHFQYLPLLSRHLEMDRFSQLQRQLYCAYPVQVRHSGEETARFAGVLLIGKYSAANTGFSLNAPLSSLQL